ncbi:MAG: hypothetical protein ACOX6P_09880 [Candidatus Merdivicinus sp.]|jgi:tetratricopeptide (TPR) repeat protein
MEKIVLSLKNIYKLLMKNDFPIYSVSVIGEKERKGQTVIRFWQDIVIKEWKSLPCGKMIWRYNDKRNRYTSQLCNRSLSSNLYPKYVRELASQISEITFLNQIDRFMQFLSSRLYNHEVLLRRIQEFIRLCQAEDPYLSEKIVGQIHKLAEMESENSEYRLFQMGYLLTLLTVCGAAGEAMGDSSLNMLFGKELSMESLWEKQNQKKTENSGKVVLWTVHAGTIQDNPLPYDHFFGQEEAIYDLQEMIRNQQKCLISGIGGIGKTELLRQLIQRCIQDDLVHYLAIIPYQNSLIDSFARAFPDFHMKESEECFHKILYQFHQQTEQGKRLLLAIDDLQGDVENDPALAQIRDLPCSVVITSRKERLDGFEVYKLSDPSVTAGTLIFRDHYGQPLPPQDRTLLKELLQKEIICHPLTLKMMARAARSRAWSVGELQAKLLEAGCSLSWVEGDRTIHLSQVYHQLYSFSQIPDECREIVELFTLLPMENLSPEFIRKIFPEVTDEMASLESVLSKLTAEGWLDQSESGYFMHPLIAQCLRRKTISEESLHPYLQGLYRQLPIELINDAWNLQFDSGEYRTIHRIMRAFGENIHGKISPEFFKAFCVAMCIVMTTKLEQDQILPLLDDLYQRCGRTDDRLTMLYALVYGFFDCPMELAPAIYRDQQAHLTVPEDLFASFCCYEGYAIRKMQPDLAEPMLLEALKRDSSVAVKALVYFYLCSLYAEQEKTELTLEMGNQGLAYVRAHPECGEILTLYNMVAPCVSYLVLDKIREAEELLEQIEKLMDEQSLPSQKLEYLHLSGIYAMRKGNLDQALERCEKAGTLCLEYWGKTRDYYTNRMQTAIILSYMKRYEDSVERYEEIRVYAKKVGHAALYARANLNLSVCLMDMGKPQEALELLTEVMDQLRQMDPLFLGEGFRNQARAYRMLGEPEKESPCLKEALPLLEASYGPEHERTVGVRERLAEFEIER